MSELLRIVVPIYQTERPSDPEACRLFIAALRNTVADEAERALNELWDSPPDNSEPIFGLDR